jgi:hypothetical protein
VKSKDLKCNVPKRSWRKGKKKVVLACSGGKEKVIHYGAKGYSDYTIHKDKARRDSFRARHKCDTKKPSKLSARFWACEDLWPMSLTRRKK